MQGFRSRSRSRRKKTVKEKRAECKALVYDAKTGKCRKSKRKRKSKRVKSVRKSVRKSVKKNVRKSVRKNVRKNNKAKKILVDYAKWVKMIDKSKSVTIPRIVSKNNKAQINPKSMKKIKKKPKWFIKVLKCLEKYIKKRRKFGMQESRQILTTRQIKQSIVTDTFELCGFVNNNNQFVLYSKGEPPSVHGRASCIPPNAPIIWHTHPQTSKFYPSVEDMRKVIKNSINTSIIFTIVGQWTITCANNWGVIPGLNKGKYIFKQLKAHNDWIYRHSDKGRINPGPQILNQYMSELMQMLANFGWNITLKYY